MRKRFYVFLIGLCCVHTAAAEGIKPRVSADIDRPRITVGDRVKLTLKVDAPEGSQCVFPDLKERVGGLEVKGVRKGPNTFEVALTSYAVGSFTIPPLSVKVTLPDGSETTLETLQLFVEVASVVKKGDPMADIRDIKGPVALPGFFLPPWTLVGILFIGAIFVWVYFLRKRIHPEPSAPPPLPHVVALEALDKLDRELLFERDVKEYHFLVSAILRRYLEDRFSVKAPEQTTEEFLESVSKDHVLEDSQKKLLESFLTQCDLVKFANLTPPGQEAHQISHIARGFIHQTKPEEEEVP